MMPSLFTTRRKPACSSIVRVTHQAIIAEGEAAALPCFALDCSRATRIGSHRQSMSRLADTTVSSRRVMAGESAGGRTLPCISGGGEEVTVAAGAADLAAAAGVAADAGADFFGAGASTARA